jgi:hypothetical protein
VSITTLLFDPSLRTRSDIASFLADKPDGTGHVIPGPTPHDGESGGPQPDPVALVKSPGGVSEVTLSARECVAGTDYDALQENMFSRVRAHSEKIGFAAGYELEIRTSAFEAAAVSGEDFQVFCLSYKLPSQGYFDLQVICDDGKICAYNRKAEGGAVHTGDLHRDSVLLHGVRFPASREDAPSRYQLCVVGYDYARLASFKDQVPTVVFVDPKERSLKLVPCSLAPSEIGDATAAVIAVLEFDPKAPVGGEWKVVPVNGCVASGSRLNTGVMTGELRKAADRASSIFEARSEDMGVASPAGQEPPAACAPEPQGASSERDFEVCLFAEGSLFDAASSIVPWCEFTTAVRCGPGFDVGGRSLEGRPNLPCWFGPIEKHCAANSKGVASAVPFSWASVRAGLEASALAVVLVSRHWSHEIAPSVSWAASALFVLVEDRPGRPEDSIMTFDRSATRMAGGCAIVLYRAITGRLLWYRGVLWDGFLDRIPDFGEDVTEAVEARIPSFVGLGGLSTQAFPKVVRAEDRTIYGVGGGGDSAPARASDVSIESAVANPEAFASACVQMSVCLPPAELKRATGTLMRLVNEWEASAREEADALEGGGAASYSRALENALESRGSARLAGELVHKRRVLRRRVAPLVASILGMESARGASSREGDLKRANRRAAVEENVRAASDMTKREIVGAIESVEEWLVAEVERPAMESLFARVSRSGKLDCAPSMAPHPTCLLLDGATVAALVEHSLENEGRHYLRHGAGVAIPSSLQNPERSAVPFPMVFSDVRDPHQLDWAALANSNKESAVWRIRLRQTLADVPGRQWGGIRASDRRLGLVVVHAVFGILERIAPSAPGAIESLDPDDTVPRLARGLMGLALATMASGTRPLTPAYKILGACAPGPMDLPDPEDAWVVAGIVRHAPVTRWPSAGLERSCARLVATIVRRHLVDPVVSPLRERSKSLKDSERQASVDETEEYLRFLGTTWHVLDRIVSGGKASDEFDGELRPVGGRLLALAPPGLTAAGSARQRGSRTRLVKFARALSRGLVDWDGELFQHTLEELVGAYAKRSGAFAEAKRELLKARAAGDSSLEASAKRSINKILADLRRRGARTAWARPQNRGGLRSEPGALEGLKGDSELKRAPWSVKGDLEAESDVLRLADYVFNGNAEGPRGSPPPGPTSPVGAGRDLAAFMRSTLGGRESAAAERLLERVSASTSEAGVFEAWTDSGIPAPLELVSLARAVCEELGFGPRLPSAALAIFEEWRDPVEGERRAAERLLGAV